MVGISSEGMSGETVMTAIQEHLTSAWKMAESDVVSTNSVRRDTEDETKEECLAATVAPMLEGKPLVLLQVNCRSNTIRLQISGT